MSSGPSFAEELDFTQTVVNTFSLQFEEAEPHTQDSKWPAQAVGPSLATSDTGFLHLELATKWLCASALLCLNSAGF